MTRWFICVVSLRSLLRVRSPRHMNFLFDEFKLRFICLTLDFHSNCALICSIAWTLSAVLLESFILDPRPFISSLACFNKKCSGSFSWYLFLISSNCNGICWYLELKVLINSIAILTLSSRTLGKTPILVSTNAFSSAMLNKSSIIGILFVYVIKCDLTSLAQSI
ncbi:hypothetical protein LELG_01824 [Lodderomyces elongisporus NRRL YB-4239]|uniref:Uncharacterized protein n=1 Tax=Lodderomyces elongisporus (strain ATCC 11503 / CBS 2605 / JCM 1781 / NBRC 1676 / NRRL YB-4239) TaxID=379508 RepID=A5DWT7_LODEL|nr:hypothetical protein LELG_01824 [Lodderomyces elongisporus NRRL YB-4239]